MNRGNPPYTKVYIEYMDLMRLGRKYGLVVEEDKSNWDFHYVLIYPKNFVQYRLRMVINPDRQRIVRVNYCEIVFTTENKSGYTVIPKGITDTYYMDSSYKEICDFLKNLEENSKKIQIAEKIAKINRRKKSLEKDFCK